MQGRGIIAAVVAVVVIVLVIAALWLLPEKEPSRTAVERADQPTIASGGSGTTTDTPAIPAPSQAVAPEAPSAMPGSATTTSEGTPAQSATKETETPATDGAATDAGKAAMSTADQGVPSSETGDRSGGQTAPPSTAGRTAGEAESGSQGAVSPTTGPVTGDGEQAASTGPADSRDPASAASPTTAPGSETTKIAESAPSQLQAPQSGTQRGDDQVTMVTPPRQPVPTATPAATPPSFDVVRISQECTAVIAGRAEPGAQVTVWEGDRPLGQVAADARGEWVLVVSEPIRSGSRQLKLIAVGADGAPVESDSVVVIAVPDCTVPAQDKEADSVIAVLTPNEGGASRVLQAPESEDRAEGEADHSTDLALKSVDYDEKGEVVLSGKAEPGKNVQAYVDNKPVGAATADEEGRWEVKPDEAIQPGVHKLRVDQVEDGGKVAARIELPFSRASAAQIVLAPGHVVVQPGNSLWRIARRTYGHGVRYTVIYQANQAQIRDPDLIYPGQIFSLPRVN